MNLTQFIFLNFDVMYSNTLFTVWGINLFLNLSSFGAVNLDKRIIDAVMKLICSVFIKSSIIFINFDNFLGCSSLLFSSKKLFINSFSFL